jgi:hypothetical protein
MSNTNQGTIVGEFFDPRTVEIPINPRMLLTGNRALTDNDMVLLRSLPEELVLPITNKLESTNKRLSDQIAELTMSADVTKTAIVKDANDTYIAIMKVIDYILKDNRTIDINIPYRKDCPHEFTMECWELLNPGNSCALNVIMNMLRKKGWSPSTRIIENANGKDDIRLYCNLN